MIKLKCLLVLFLVIPGCITLNTPAKADYVFCHGQQGIGPAYFAFAWQGKSGEFESKGWYELGYGDCITPWKGKPGTYFLHADPKEDADITIIRKSCET